MDRRHRSKKDRPLGRPGIAISGCGEQDRRVGELTRLLQAARDGESGAVDQIVARTYRELHQLAHQRLQRLPRNTLLDTTSLVHECYLRLVKVGEIGATDRSHFLSYAARVMRSVVVDIARERLAQRRGGDRLHITLATDVADPSAIDQEQIVRVDEALTELARLDERLVQVVEMKYFAGLTSDEIAVALGVAERTVRRDWQKARVLLHQELEGRGVSAPE
jgi:RNA polymerase sigma factor (TIGR02999 family)